MAVESAKFPRGNAVRDSISLGAFSALSPVAEEGDLALEEQDVDACNSNNEARNEASNGARSEAGHDGRGNSRTTSPVSEMSGLSNVSDFSEDFLVEDSRHSTVLDVVRMQAPDMRFLTAAVRVVAASCGLVSTTIVLHAAASPMGSAKFSAVDVFVRSSSLVLMDVMTAVTVFGGFVGGLLEAVVQDGAGRDVLQVFWTVSLVDSIVSTILTTFFGVVCALIQAALKPDMIKWTLLDGLLQTNVSVFANAPTLRPEGWIFMSIIHVVSYCMLVMFCLQQRKITHAAVIGPSGPATSWFGAVAGGLLVVTHVTLCVSMMHLQVFEIALKTSFLRLGQALSGGLAAWLCLAHPHGARHLGALAWKSRKVAGGVLALLWAEQVGQPLQATPLPHCAFAVHETACIPTWQVCMPRAWLLLWIGAGSVLRRCRPGALARDDEAGPSQDPTEEEATEWRVACLQCSFAVSSIILAWPLVCAFIVLCEICGVYTALSANALVVPSMLLFCGSVHWLYITRVRAVCHAALSQALVHAWGVLAFARQRICRL